MSEFHDPSTLGVGDAQIVMIGVLGGSGLILTILAVVLFDCFLKRKFAVPQGASSPAGPAHAPSRPNRTSNTRPRVVASLPQ